MKPFLLTAAGVAASLLVLTVVSLPARPHGRRRAPAGRDRLPHAGSRRARLRCSRGCRGSPAARPRGGGASSGRFAGRSSRCSRGCSLHELAHRDAARGPRIVKFINRVVGRWRNHAALWVTSVALPGFLFIRLVEVVCYPMLVWLLDFPRYSQADWVNVSRQKFDGPRRPRPDLVPLLRLDDRRLLARRRDAPQRRVVLVPDPLRDGKKCDNCKLDFPDLAHGWVPATADHVRRRADAGDILRRRQPRVVRPPDADHGQGAGPRRTKPARRRRRPSAVADDHAP